MIPPTPFVDGRGGPATASLPPRTPYTPYTAFAAKQNPFDAVFGQAPAAHLLAEDDGEPLAALYNALLRFVERELARTMDAAERISARSAGPRAADGASADRLQAREERRGFDIMANVVWAEIARTVMDELGSAIFAAGKPSQFRKVALPPLRLAYPSLTAGGQNYETTQAFIRALEFLAPSADAIGAMRAHPAFGAFARRWQLPVYFQLRWKEIVGVLEPALATTRLDDTGAGTCYSLRGSTGH
jgi:hypothetical protein